MSDHSFHQDAAGEPGQMPALSPFHGRQIRAPRTARPALTGTDLYGAHAPAHEDPAIDYRKHLATLVKHIRLIAGITAISLALGLFHTLLQTPTYRASATIQIKREAANISGIAGLESVEAGRGDEFYQTQYELLKSRALAELVVSSLGLADVPEFYGANSSRGQAWEHSCLGRPRPRRPTSPGARQWPQAPF